MDPEQMQKRAWTFYTNLFSPLSTLMPVRAYGMNSQQSAWVSTTDWSILSLWLSSQKPSNKSPGINRLTEEFHCVFQDEFLRSRVLPLVMQVGYAHPAAEEGGYLQPEELVPNIVTQHGL